jgi:hypothetical protein
VVFGRITTREAIVKAIIIGMALYLGQMNTLQEKPVVHLQPHSPAIRADFGGKLLELINAPAVVNLPPIPPKVDSQGSPWEVDLKNLGPGGVTVVGENLFSARVAVGRTLQITSNGRIYSVKH